MRDFRFRAWDGMRKMMFDVDVLAISPCTWDCPDYGRNGVSLSYQPSIEVMQYTGLNDCKSQPIYEGDILQNGYQKAVVIYLPRHAAFCAKGISGMDDSLWNAQFTKVIGNIFENPEIFEGI